MDNIKYYDRFNKETIYLWNDDAECYVKFDPITGTFAKYKGRNEFRIASVY
ncbi:MAG TPA: hypothetical protein VGP43_02535 [Chitinophagaceae bacterium]|nr:hypothetical protein [Chitinophagaceae bacterium]